jgi:hypothetical protein
MMDLSYYSDFGPMTDPGPFSSLLDDLPGDVAELCHVVQGTTMHIFWAERYGLNLPNQRKEEVQLRSLRRRLARMQELDARPLTEPRSLERRIVGNCRDFTLLLVSMLRRVGIPARARCGFGAYFLPNHYVDHWVAEYWDDARQRWVLVDAQLDAFQREALKISFDPADVPRNQFIVSGKAWHMCRTGEADPESFGIFEMHGLWFIRDDLVRDVAAFGKVELLPWDCWGIIEKKQLDDPEDLAALDAAGELTRSESPDAAAIRELYDRDSRFTVGRVIASWVEGQRKEVTFGELGNDR